MKTATVIDLYTPSQAGAVLQFDDTALLDAVNRGMLPAYDLGEGIRFRVNDVTALARDLVAA